jgi:2-oxoglutarate dehydrogenase E1 component
VLFGAVSSPSRESTRPLTKAGPTDPLPLGNGNGNGNGADYAHGNGASVANGRAAPPALSAAPPVTREIAAPPEVAPAPPTAQVAPPAPAPAPPPAVAPPEEAASAPSEDAPVPLRGVAARIVTNMVESLTVPTATSVHPLPAKVLEVNRRTINEYLERTTGAKVSYTHLIGYAVVRALVAFPSLNSGFIGDIDGSGGPGVVHHTHVNLGIAIDLERPNGRSLVVPAVRSADTLDFPGFVAAYEDLVRRARDSKLAIEDLTDVTVTITNPGTLGTTQSVPRLMAGQGAIIGVGALDFPVEYQATDPATLAALGVSKVLTLTSTYDHRIIQGAESGLFLKHIHELLIGEHNFYDEVFAALSVPTAPARWQRDRHAAEGLSTTSAADAVAIRALIDAYRSRGHLAAALDPLAAQPPAPVAELDPSSYGLSVWDLDRSFPTGGLAGRETRTLASILDICRRAYCETIGAEFMHIPTAAERVFFEERLEGVEHRLSDEEAKAALGQLTAAEVFERFLHARYVGQRRFSLEGGEAAIVFLDALLESAASSGVLEAVLGMAHRGRLNTLANIVGKPYEEIFADFEGTVDPLTVQGSGDVKYHKGGQGSWVGRSGATLPVVMASNPSHLEAVNAVVEGMARALEERLGEGHAESVLPIVIHGDASMAGQGVVAETFNLSLIEGYYTGGTVHFVINNQLGFTTPPESARSTRYATDVAKMVDAPILHVNGDDPEAVVACARIAMAYRAEFHKDVVVDLICYRLLGHNEGDDPSYTQPLMYRAIEQHPSARAHYAEDLVRRGILVAEETQAMVDDVTARMGEALARTRQTPAARFDHLPAQLRPVVPTLAFPTGADRAILDRIAHRLHHAPAAFHVHPKLERQLVQREQAYKSDGEVDWALAEGLAFATLVLEGTSVRLTGQDSRRGTFSQRHAVLVDYESGAEYTPLTALGEAVDDEGPLAPADGLGQFEVRDSVLSEYSGLGFEYGYSVVRDDSLVLWEAQFGDFANGAQIIIDNFITAAEEKWGQFSGLVMLLPHGFEGQGPEHSSARLERYLALAGGGNIAIAQPTTAAQYFHLLRSQAYVTPRRPLVIITPKSLLRTRAAKSSVADLADGAFAEVLDDPAGIAPDAVERILVVSGKIAFELAERREHIGATGSVAIVRVEQLYPWPEAELAAVLSRYPRASELIWTQDEPENMGAWTYVRPRLEALAAGRRAVRHISRRDSGSPATGSHLLHELESDKILDEAIGAETKV